MPKRSVAFLMTPKASDRPFKKAKAQEVSLTVGKKKKRQKYGHQGAEIKFLDVGTVFTADVTAQVLSMSTMAQGLTNITRVGNKIQIKSAAVKVHAGPLVAATAVVPNVHRWSIVLDKEPEPAAIASYNQIYTANNAVSFNNLNESDRFVILATGTWWHGGRATGSGVSYSDGGDMCYLLDERRVCDIAAKYQLATATQTAIASNQLLFTFVSENIDTNMSFTANTRIRYTDE